MSSGKAENQLGPCLKNDQRTLAGQRRNQARTKMNEAAVDLVSQALQNGVPAQYVLFDSWYSSPKMFDLINQLGLDGVGMLKRSKKVYYRYRKRLYSVKTLYQRLQTEGRKSKEGATYQYSCVVESLSGVELKLVFVSNRHHANNYLVLATTKTSLRPNEIIQLYGRRWQIETYFKAAKQYLRFDQTQVQKYDGLCGHLAMVMMTYDLLAWQERQERDDRTIGDLFYSVKTLYQRLQTEGRKSKEGATYQYSCVVESLSGVELKLVFVSNRHHANNYLVLATTKTSLRPNEIIQLYGRRWQIETYFKAAKQYLRFDQTQVQKYDGLCGHLAMVMMTYDLLAWQERQERDDRTIGDLFYIMGEAMPDLNITEVLVWFVKTLQEFMEDEPIIPRNLLEGTVNQFIKHLPQSVAKQFQAA